MNHKYLDHPFGIEIEFTGIDRYMIPLILDYRFLQASDLWLSRSGHLIGKMTDRDGMVWRIKYDGSIGTQKKAPDGGIIPADEKYSVELVSPILRYSRDIEKLQWVIRKLAKAGAFVNESCGIHIHLDGAGHTPQSVKNFCNIVASREDLFAKALSINNNRLRRYCCDLEGTFMQELNELNPLSLETIEKAWYQDWDCDPTIHYHPSRYCFLNLHSLFHGHHTLELRCFNSTLHAGVVRAYIAFALGLNGLALSTRHTWYRKVETDNPRYTMVHFLQRIGLKGQEFANCRMHLTKHLPGDPNWRHEQRAA